VAIQHSIQSNKAISEAVRSPGLSSILFIVPGDQHEIPLQNQTGLALFKRGKPNIPQKKSIAWDQSGVKKYLGISKTAGYTDWVIMDTNTFAKLR
jgi:hypothetical protein